MDTARSIVYSVTHYIKNTDLYLMLLGLVCSIYGMLLIYSATLNPVTALDGSTKNLYVQGAAIILGLAAFVALSLIDLENLGDLWKIFVIGNILLLFLLFTPLGTEVKDYQKTRILVLFDPSIDVEQSRQATYGKIAIGSGQFTGQGWTNGTMTQMQYVPENQTDYIFSVAGEELGFLGCLLIIILLMALIIRLFYVAYRASTPFSALIAVGVGGMLLFQTFMNIFMNVGLLPVMGLTLPFFSYGGTSIVTMFAALGIAAGVRMREKPSWLQN